ncbi:MAG: hypothetical protein QOI64_1918 [Solirubrobacteraceae bacterium]|jgi:hypothetical protein|nr:hypothetical protein [Solirubrobacteraceae bacterium]
MPTPTPPTYRQRLRLEGTMLAASGGLAGVLLLAFVDEASERAASTALQISFVAAVLAVAGPFYVRRWLSAAQPVAPGAELTGQPTALWKPPLVVMVLIALFVVPGELGIGAVGWDAGLRIALACMLVGLAQALLVERLVASDEARHGRRYIRLPGSRATSGTNLGFFLNKHA